QRDCCKDLVADVVFKRPCGQSTKKFMLANMGHFRFAPCSFLLLITACSTDYVPQTCALDSDCGTGLVCEMRDSEPVCVKAEDAQLVIGHHSALSGTNQALGTNMKIGIELAFKEQNDAGGIRGRQLTLDFRDDAY